MNVHAHNSEHTSWRINQVSLFFHLLKVHNNSTKHTISTDPGLQSRNSSSGKALVYLYWSYCTKVSWPLGLLSSLCKTCLFFNNDFCSHVAWKLDGDFKNISYRAFIYLIKWGIGVLAKRHIISKTYQSSLRPTIRAILRFPLYETSWINKNTFAPQQITI